MGIVFRRTTENTQPSEKSLDISGVEGKEYDLEEIEAGKSRTSTTALAVQTSGDISENEGSLYLSSEKASVRGIKDATKKYLLDN